MKHTIQLFLLLLLMGMNGMAQIPTITNSYIVPANPTETDTIFLVSTTNFGFAPNTMQSRWANENDYVITVASYHRIGLVPYPEPSTDVIYVGSFDSGEYQLIYQIQVTNPIDPVVVYDTLFFTIQESIEYLNSDSITELNIPLNLSEGWNLIGYTCQEPLNVIEAFSSVEDKIIIVKDNLGNSYLPEWEFNGIGDLEFSKGYQLKLTEVINNFYFCPSLIRSE